MTSSLFNVHFGIDFLRNDTVRTYLTIEINFISIEFIRIERFSSWGFVLMHTHVWTKILSEWRSNVWIFIITSENRMKKISWNFWKNTKLTKMQMTSNNNKYIFRDYNQRFNKISLALFLNENTYHVALLIIVSKLNKPNCISREDRYFKQEIHWSLC